MKLSSESCENLAGDLCNNCIVRAAAAALTVRALAVCSTLVGAGLASGVLTGKTHLLTELHESLELVAGDLLNVSVLAYADLTSIEVDLCIELYLFHGEACAEKSVTYGESTVVLKKECVVLLDVGHKRVRDLHGGGHTVIARGNVTDGKDRLGKDVLVKLYTCNCECCCNGGMSVNDSVNVGTLLEDSHVHLDLGGGVELTVDLVALAVYLNDHIGGHVTLGYSGRCAVELVGSYLYGDITIVSCYETVVINSLTDFAYFFFDFKG